MIDIKQSLEVLSVFLEHSVLRKVFKSHYKAKDDHAAFIERFPCCHCRPDGCTFYWNIPCKCNKCGREYHI